MCGFDAFLQTVLNEITSYEPNIQMVEADAQQLLDSDHFASDTIHGQNTELKHKWKELKLLAARRTQKLSSSLEAQKVSFVCWFVCLFVCCTTSFIVR